MFLIQYSVKASTSYVGHLVQLSQGSIIRYCMLCDSLFLILVSTFTLEKEYYLDFNLKFVYIILDICYVVITESSEAMTETRRPILL